MTYVGVVNCFHHIRADVVDLDVLACNRIADCPAIVSLGLFVLVSLDLTLACLVLFLFSVDFGVPLLLILVQALHELLNVGNPVCARIVARRRLMLLLLHVAYVCNCEQLELYERKKCG